jgi:CxxC motif-containing protein
MEIKRMTCINCPMGCSLEVTVEDEIKVSGNRCIRGREYAASEITDPQRTVTSTVRIFNGDKSLASVKTDREISKRLIFEVMRIINDINIEAPVRIGDVLTTNILGTAVNVVVTCNVSRVSGK